MTPLTMWLLLGTFVAVDCDLSGSILKDVYNTPVEIAEWVFRPQQGMPDWVPGCFTTHSGVRVTLKDGRKFLIHKGQETSKVVVLNAAHMFHEWQVMATKQVLGIYNVWFFVEAAAEKDSIWTQQHCHT